jgi:hypothetical protein
VGEFLDRVQDRPPFRHGLAGEECVETGDQRSQFPSGLRAGPHLGDDPVVFLISRPIAMAGRIDGRHRETALGCEAAGTRHDAGGLLVLAAAVSHQDPGGGSRRRRPASTAKVRVKSCSVTPSDATRRRDGVPHRSGIEKCSSPGRT